MGSCQSVLKNARNRENKKAAIQAAPPDSLSILDKSRVKKTLSTGKLADVHPNNINVNTVVAVDPTEVISAAAVAPASEVVSLGVATTNAVPIKGKKKIIVLNGAPGSGKDTQCNLILKKFHLELIICSGVLKNYLNKHKKTGEEPTEQKPENELTEEEKILDIIEKSFANGSLVPDDTVIKIFTSELNSILNDENNDVQGVLINGFPRTKEQAMLFKESKIQVDALINIIVSKENLWTRISSRLVDPVTNISYDANVIELVKKKKQGADLSEEELKIVSQNELCDNLDDEIIDRLDKRKDDTQEVFDKRFALYKENDEQITSVFKDVCRNVDGNKQKDEVFNDIIKIIEEVMNSSTEPAEQPVEQSLEQPVEQSLEQPVEQSLEQPVEQSLEQPVEQPTE